MAETIGIKLKIDGEQEFKQAITDANVKLKTLGSELELIKSSYDKNDRSVENLTRQNETLTKQMDVQKDKVGTLKSALESSNKAIKDGADAQEKQKTKVVDLSNQLEKAKSKYGENSKEVKELEKELSKAESELSKMEAKTRTNTNTSEKWQNELNKAHTELNKLQKEVDGNVKEINEMSDASKKAEKSVDGFGKEVNKVDGELDKAGKSASVFGDVVKANLTSGMITAVIKNFGEAIKNVAQYMMGAITSASGYGKEISLMSEKTGISTESLQKFKAASKTTGVEVEQFTSSLAKSIKSMNNATDASKGTGATYKALGVNVRDSKGQLRDAETVYWETVDALKAMDNETQRDAYSMQLFGKSAMELNPIIKRGSEGFREITDSVSTFDDTTIESLRGLDISMGKLGATMDNIKRSIGVAFAPMMKEIADAASDVGGKLKNIFMGISKGEDQEKINQRFDELRESILTLAEKIKEQMPNFMRVGGQIISAVWEGVQTALGSFMPQLIGIGLLLAAVAAGWGALMATALLAWPVFLGLALAGIIAVFWPQISEGLSNLWQNITAWLGETWNNLTEWFINLKDNMINKSKDMLNAVIDWFKRLPGDIWNAIIGAFQKVHEWGTNLAAKGKEAAQNLWNSIIDNIKNLPHELFNIGKDLVKGIWEGIKSTGDWLWQQVKGFFGGLMDSIKGFLGINSPSKLFSDVVGKGMAEGIGVGFADEMGNVNEDMQKALNTDFAVAAIANINSAMNEVQPHPTLTIDYEKLGEATAKAIARSGFALIANDREIARYMRNMGVVMG